MKMFATTLRFQKMLAILIPAKSFTVVHCIENAFRISSTRICYY
jgi:hypothetical protein